DRGVAVIDRERIVDALARRAERHESAGVRVPGARVKLVAVRQDAALRAAGGAGCIKYARLARGRDANPAGGLWRRHSRAVVEHEREPVRAGADPAFELLAPLRCNE